MVSPGLPSRCPRPLVSPPVARSRYDFRPSFVFARLPWTYLVTHHIPISEQAKLSPFPVVSLMRCGNDPNHSPITFRGRRHSSDGSSDYTQYLVQIREDLMFPDPHHDPPQGFEFASKPAIALGIGSELLCPKLFPGPRSRIVCRTPVPEAPIDGNRDLRTRKDYVRTPDRHLVVQAVS